MKKSITNINPKARKKEKKHSTWSLYIQLFLTIFLLVLGVVTLFQKSLFPWFLLLLAVTIFDMGLNNVLIYKRKYVTYLYFAVALITFVLAIMNFLGV